MKTSQLIQLDEGDCIHVIRKDRPHQIGLVKGPALVIVVEEAAAATTASDPTRKRIQSGNYE